MTLCCIYLCSQLELIQVCLNKKVMKRSFYENYLVWVELHTNISVWLLDLNMKGLGSVINLTSDTERVPWIVCSISRERFFFHRRPSYHHGQMSVCGGTEDKCLCDISTLQTETHKHSEHRQTWKQRFCGLSVCLLLSLLDDLHQQQMDSTII